MKCSCTQFLAQGLSLSSLDKNWERQPLVYQRLQARSKGPLALAPIEKCISQGEKNCETTCRIYYQRQSTTNGRAHRETVCLFQTEAGQKYTQESEPVGSSLRRRSPVKRWSNHLYQQFFWVFVYLWIVVWFLFPHLPCPGLLPNTHVQLFSRMDSHPKACRMALASPILR